MFLPERGVAIAWVALLALSSCSYAWGVPSTDLTIVDATLLTGQKLSHVPAGFATLVLGPDGVPWAAFCEKSAFLYNDPVKDCKRLRTVKLAADRADEVWDGDSFQLENRAIYILVDAPDSKSRRVTVHRPGDPTAEDGHFEVPSGRAVLMANQGADNDIFVYLVLSLATTHYDVYRRDKLFHLTLPVPPNQVFADDYTSFFLLTGDGRRLVVLEPTPPLPPSYDSSRVTAYSTLDGSSVSLGTYDALPGNSILIDDAHQALLTAAFDFRTRPLAGGPTKVLSHQAVGDLYLDGRENAYYTTYTHGTYDPGDADLYRVPLDGSAPPALVQEHVDHILGMGPVEKVVYSRDSAYRYVYGAGSGWLGAFQFMERGFFAGFSPDGTRVRYFEHAASYYFSAPLQSRSIAEGAAGQALTLALNASGAHQLANGPLLVLENQAVLGTWNRLVAVDEPARTSRHLVEGAAGLSVLPDESSMVVDVVTAASGYDIVLFPLK